LIATGGAYALTLIGSGSFTLSGTYPGQPPLACSGTWSASSDTFTLHFITGLFGEWQFDMALSGSTLTLSGANAEFDFDGDDQDDPAKLTIVMTRQ
jgi:hypothetical protein